MGAIDIYLKEISRRYPGTQAVREQIEELRDTLHLKTEELQAQGRPYELAEQAAIASLGDVSPLMREVAGDERSVYINRLNRNNAILSSSLMLAEFITAWIIVLFTVSQVFFFIPFTYSTIGLIVGLGIWVAISVITWKREPKKTGVVDFSFCRQMRMAVIGWLCLSLVVLGVNLLMGLYIKPNIMWFQWTVIGIANWPLNIWLYNRQLTGGRYDARGI